MYTIYVYVLDTLADWEIGYVTAELHSGRFFKKDAPRLSLKTVSDSKLPILTMGVKQACWCCQVQIPGMTQNTAPLSKKLANFSL